MFKVIVDEKIVDLLSNNIRYVYVDKDDNVMLCNEKGANAVLCYFGNVYQIQNRDNFESTRHPICSLLSIEQDEFDSLKEELSKNIVVDCVNNEVVEEQEPNEPQPINLMNKIADLEAKLNELLNK